MEILASFFANNMVFVFFIYGLAWFIMGLAILLTTRGSLGLKLAESLPWLAAFGIAHGIVEWGDMLRLTQVPASGISYGAFLSPLKVVLLGLSTAFLFQFGAHLMASTNNGLRWLKGLPPIFFGLWLFSPVFVPALFSTGGWQAPPAGSCLQCHTTLPVTGGPEHVAAGGEWLSAAEVWARYLLYLPGLILSAIGMWQQGRPFQEMGLSRTARDCRIIAIVFGVNMIFAGLVVSPAPYFPASVLNYHTFLAAVPIPPQVFRAAVAVVSAFFIVRVLRVFEAEHEKQLEEARRERQQAQELYVSELERLNRELEGRVAERTQSLATLLESATTLASTLDLDTLLEKTMSRIATVAGPVEAGLLFLYDEDFQALVSGSCFGCQTAPLEAVALRSGEAIAGRAFATAQPIFDTDLESIAEAMGNLSPGNAQHLEAALPCLTLPRNVVAVPLVSKGRAIGVLQLVNFEHPEEVDIELLRGLADQIAIAVDNARLYEEVQRKEQLRGQLLERVIRAQEEERRRIARELHDEAGQVLTAVMMNVAAAEQVLPGRAGVAKAKLQETRELAGKALADVRKIILDLRPEMLDDLGLVPALRWYVRNRLGSAGIEGKLEVSRMKGRFAPQVEATIFRVVQEAVTNIVRHAGAKTARIRVEIKEGALHALVEDDGVGFSAGAVMATQGVGQGWGLRGMEERVGLLGGSFRVESAPGQGTRLSIKIPLEEATDGEQDTNSAGRRSRPGARRHPIAAGDSKRL